MTRSPVVPLVLCLMDRSCCGLSCCCVHSAAHDIIKYNVYSVHITAALHCTVQCSAPIAVHRAPYYVIAQNVYHVVKILHVSRCCRPLSTSYEISWYTHMLAQTCVTNNMIYSTPCTRQADRAMSEAEKALTQAEAQAKIKCSVNPPSRPSGLGTTGAKAPSCILPAPGRLEPHTGTTCLPHSPITRIDQMSSVQQQKLQLEAWKMVCSVPLVSDVVTLMPYCTASA